MAVGAEEGPLGPEEGPVPQSPPSKNIYLYDIFHLFSTHIHTLQRTQTQVRPRDVLPT